MTNTVITLKKSGTPLATPGILANGEIAINYADGKLFYKDSTGSIQQISGGGNNFSIINAAGTLVVADLQNDILTLDQGDNIVITGDIVNDKITIAANLATVFGVANAAYNSANSLAGGLDVTTVYNTANAAYDKANSKTYTFYQTSAPATSNAHDLWVNSNTGIVYENFGTTSAPIWAEFGPVGVSTTITTNRDVQAYDTANAAFGHSNTTYTAVNSAFGVVNSAFGKANTALQNTTGVFAGDLTVTGNVIHNKQAVIYYTPAAQVNAAVHIAAANTKGGTGYADVFKLTNLSGGAINPDKWIRLDANGGFQIINNAYNSNLITLSDSGNLAVAGNVTMSGIQPGYSVNRPGFRVTGSGTTNNLTTTQNGTGILNSNNWSVDYNQGSYLNGTTGVFTAPVDGLYQVNLVGRNSGYSSGISQIAITKNSAASVVCMLEFASSSSMNHAGVSSVVKLAVGDTLDMRVLAGQINFDGNDNWSVAYIG